MNNYTKYPALLMLLFVLCDYEANCKGETPLSRRKRYVVFPEGSSFSIALCMTMHTLTPDNIFTEGLNWGISYDLPNESKQALEPFLQLRKDRIKVKQDDIKYGIDKYKHRYQQQQQFVSHAAPNKNRLKYSMGWHDHGKYYVLPSGKKGYKSEYYYLQRRHRRDLYNKLEVIMRAMGFDGRSCVLRALCEASQRLMPKGNTLVEEMMRISFSLPLKRVLSYEPEEHRTYTDAHKAGHDGHDCTAMYPGCGFSIIDMALGKYNAPPSRDPATDYAAAAAEAHGTQPPDWTRYNMK